MRFNDELPSVDFSGTVGHLLVKILDVNYANLSRPEVVNWVEQRIATRQPSVICTPNASHLIIRRHNPSFRRALSHADLVISDGMAVVYASHLLGNPLRENVGGRLLIDAIASASTLRNYRIFLLGGGERDTAERAAAALRIRYPGLTIAGTYWPPLMSTISSAESRRMIDAVRAASPDVLFVALGTPKQEVWLAKHRSVLNVPVSIGIGAGLDMLAGDVRLPPRWMTTVGVEWLSRLVQDPRRLWRRYLVDGPHFVGLVVRSWVSQRRAR